MAAVTTERLLRLALDLANLDDVPAECKVFYPGSRINHVLVGLDIGPAELFLARQLGYHAVISHSASPLARTHRLLQPRLERMTALGIPSEVASQLIGGVETSARLRSLAENVDAGPSIARLLEMPYLSIGAATDELACATLQAAVDELAPDEPTVAEVHDRLISLPVLAHANPLPMLARGAVGAPAGKVLVEMGPISAAIIRAYFAAGVGTLCCPAVTPEEVARAWDTAAASGNILVLGRSACEATGMLPYIHRLREEGIEVTTCSGIVDRS